MKIVRESLNEIKRNDNRISTLGIGGMHELRDNILEILTDHGCVQSEKRFEFISEESIISQFKWVAKIFESPENLVAQVDLDDADDIGSMIREIKGTMLKGDGVLAVHRKSWNDIDTEWGKIERTDIMANMLVAVISEKFEDSETEELVLINRRMLNLSDDVNESSAMNTTDNKMFEIKRGGSERESMGVGYVGMIKNILSDIPRENYHRGEEISGQDSEESIQIIEIIQKEFNCKKEDIDVADIGSGPDSADIINRLRNYVPDENYVNTVISDHSKHELRFGRYFAVIVERPTTGFGYQDNYFHIALDNRHIRLH